MPHWNPEFLNEISYNPTDEELGDITAGPGQPATLGGYAGRFARKWVADPLRGMYRAVEKAQSGKFKSPEEMGQAAFDFAANMAGAPGHGAGLGSGARIAPWNSRLLDTLIGKGRKKMPETATPEVWAGKLKGAAVPKEELAIALPFLQEADPKSKLTGDQIRTALMVPQGDRPSLPMRGVELKTLGGTDRAMRLKELDAQIDLISEETQRRALQVDDRNLLYMDARGNPLTNTRSPQAPTYRETPHQYLMRTDPEYLARIEEMDRLLELREKVDVDSEAAIFPGSWPGSNIPELKNPAEHLYTYQPKGVPAYSNSDMRLHHQKHGKNVAFYTREGDLEFPDGTTSRHMSEAQSDWFAAFTKQKKEVPATPGANAATGAVIDFGIGAVPESLAGVRRLRNSPDGPERYIVHNTRTDEALSSRSFETEDAARNFINQRVQQARENANTAADVPDGYFITPNNERWRRSNMRITEEGGNYFITDPNGAPGARNAFPTREAAQAAIDAGREEVYNIGGYHLHRDAVDITPWRHDGEDRFVITYNAPGREGHGLRLEPTHTPYETREQAEAAIRSRLVGAVEPNSVLDVGGYRFPSRNVSITEVDPGRYVVSDNRTGMTISDGRFNSEEAAREWITQNTVDPNKPQRVPEPPFGKDWYKAAIKDTVRRAVEAGHEYVSFDPADTHISRWNLSGSNAENVKRLYAKELPEFIEKELGGKLEEVSVNKPEPKPNKDNYRITDAWGRWHEFPPDHFSVLPDPEYPGREGFTVYGQSPTDGRYIPLSHRFDTEAAALEYRDALMENAQRTPPIENLPHIWVGNERVGWNDLRISPDPDDSSRFVIEYRTPEGWDNLGNSYSTESRARRAMMRQLDNDNNFPRDPDTLLPVHPDDMIVMRNPNNNLFTIGRRGDGRNNEPREYSLGIADFQTEAAARDAIHEISQEAINTRVEPFSDIDSSIQERKVLRFKIPDKLKKQIELEGLYFSKAATPGGRNAEGIA